MADVFVFAGPSSFGLDQAILRTEHHSWLPPARRGDIDRLLQQHPEPGVVVLCDGVFQAAPAVSHVELCQAIDAGWDVWGTSSIGAIRAYELRFEGMRGFGRVHALFASDPSLTDDEVCLLHLPEPPWFPASEALVNLRIALEDVGPSLSIATAAGARVVAALGALWFGDRTMARIRATMINVGGIDEVVTDRLLDALEINRAKTDDLARLLVERPWSR